MSIEEANFDNSDVKTQNRTRMIGNYFVGKTFLN